MSIVPALRKYGAKKCVDMVAHWSHVVNSVILWARVRMGVHMPGKIQRHKTAIKRGDLSRPVRLLLGSKLLTEERSFFDLGCGHGEDVRLLKERGFEARGWDPHYAPERPKREADVVAITYVINVIEDPSERADALVEAWSLARKVLAVSAQATVDQTGKYQLPYSDGIVTGLGTFQKYYTQQELKAYIEETLSVTAHPAALGVYLVFRDEQLARLFEIGRFRRRIQARRQDVAAAEDEELEPYVETLADFFFERGRFPRNEELDDFSEPIERLGGKTRARRFLGILYEDELEAVRDAREEDLLLYIALGAFQRSLPKYSSLPRPVQLDIKALFGSYKKSKEIAEYLLYGLGEEGTIANACRSAPIGKLLPEALYVHAEYVDSLPLMLRLFEGLASRYIGTVDGATLVKFHMRAAGVSYLFYPDFDSNPHPALAGAIQVSLSDLHIGFVDYSERGNPPILHRKELFVGADYPHRKKFARLTKQEERHGLYDNPRRIGTRKGWEEMLASKGVALRGHRLVKVDR
jgi:DNA phosphorothioation-associated putative methyltransferase